METKIESRIISDLKSQYTESEEQIRQRKEQFLKKQKKIILIEIIAGAVFLAFLIIRAAFLQDDYFTESKFIWSRIKRSAAIFKKRMTRKRR